jgi:uncharacterized membrane protein (DUF2068 family)
MKPLPEKPKGRAPTLYAIIGIKLLKGLLLLLVGFGVLSLVGQDLDMRFDQFLRWIHLDPEKKFFAELGTKLQHMTPNSVRGIGIGTVLYSFFSLIEGVGLMFRLAWIGWIVIGESLFFIPIEVYDLMRRFSMTVFVILLINVVIVWYLLKNKERLFRHHHH